MLSSRQGFNRPIVNVEWPEGLEELYLRGPFDQVWLEKYSYGHNCLGENSRKAFRYESELVYSVSGERVA